MVNEIHTLVGARGGRDGGAMDAANILKPALARGDMQIVGATTVEEYRKYVEKDKALERRFQPVSVEAVQILRGIARKYEVPVEKVSADESIRLVHLEDLLHNRVIGQEESVVAIAKEVLRPRAGLQNPKRPIASFIFCGLTGVGKTELCKALAEAYFGMEDAVIRLDMSEFMEKHTVAKLIGSAPGYVGNDEESQLTDPVAVEREERSCQ